MRVSSCPVMVGRETEVQDLLRLLRQAASARRVEVVLVYGEAGIGKTRLVEEFRRRLGDIPSYVCGCTPSSPHSERAEPLAPLVQLLRSMTVTVQAAPVLRTTAVAEETIKALDDAVRQAPVVVIIEDCQWADDGTLDFISLMSTRNPPGGLLLVLTERLPESQALGWRRVALSSKPAPGTHLVHLAGLDRQETAKLMSLRAPERSSTLLIERVFRLGKGNPLLTEELQDAAHETTNGIPFSLREALRRRVSRLPPNARWMLGLLAVAGRPLASVLVDRLAGSAGRTTLQELIDEGVVVEEAPYIRFSHPLYLEILGSLIPVRERMDLHRTIAEALSDWSDPIESEQSIKVQLADHWHECGSAEEAFMSAVDAAVAIERATPRDASFLYTRAMERASNLSAWPHPTIGPIELRRRAALAALYAGEAEQALLLLNEALDMCTPDDKPPRALLLEQRGRILHEQSDESAGAAFLEALEALEPGTPVDVVVRVKAGAGLARVDSGQWEAGLSLLAEASRLAAESTDPLLESIVECDQATVDLRLGRAASAAIHADRSRALGTQADSAHQVISGYVVGARAHYLETGDLRASIDMRAKGLEYALSHGQARTAGTALQLSLIEDLIEIGDWERAQRLLDDLPRTAGGRLNVTDGELARVFLASRRGEDVRLAVPLEELARSSDAVYESYFLSLAIPIALCGGDLSTLRRLETRAVALSNSGDPTIAGRALYLVDALAWAMQGEADLETTAEQRTQRARELLRRANRMFEVGRAGTPAKREFTDGVIEVARGEMERAAGRPGTKHWATAIDHFRYAGARPRLAYALFRHAESLHAGGRAKSQCCVELDEALSLARGIGATPLVYEIENLARRFGHVPQEKLSPREIEVAALVAQGKRRANVADVLGISVKTVDAHMARIFGKLRIGNATELVAWYHKTLGSRRHSGPFRGAI